MNQHDGAILSGVRVVELGQYLAAPTATKLMADLGADVIKLEIAPRGDLTRVYLPIGGGQSVAFFTFNRGKRSVCVDIKRPEGAAIAIQLIARSDVFVENLTPGVLAKYGFGYEALRLRNPRLIMCSISGFGQQGAYANKPANDIIALAFSGTLHMIGYPDTAPAVPAINIGDLSTGTHACGAICAALYRREKTGLGQFIDISMVDCLASWNDGAYLDYQVSGGKRNPSRMGSHFPSVSPMGVFKARDGYVVITVLFDQWELFTKIIGKPELAHDPRFDTMDKRVRNRPQVTEIVETWLQSFPGRAQALEVLDQHHILNGPVLDVPQAMNGEGLVARDALRLLDQPGAGAFQTMRAPMRFSDSPVEIARPSPILGEHNHQVLSELLDFSEKQIVELTDAGVLAQDTTLAR